MGRGGVGLWWVVTINRRASGVEGVEVEEFGIGEEVEVAFAEVDLAGELLVGGGDGVEVGEVLRDVGGTAPRVARGHDWQCEEGCRGRVSGEVLMPVWWER